MREAVERKGIKNLWHFTRIENTKSILLNGIVPRSLHDEKAIITTYNDPYRLDGFISANCLSISYPNYKMFYRLRYENPGSEWVVMAIDPCILWGKKCAFCHDNAASSCVRAIPVQNRMGQTAFENLFSPVEGKPTRDELGLPDRFTTNPQAEVLVFDTIEPSYIKGIVVDSSKNEARIKQISDGKTVAFRKEHFSPRDDYEHWR